VLGCEEQRDGDGGHDIVDGVDLRGKSRDIRWLVGWSVGVRMSEGCCPEVRLSAVWSQGRILSTVGKMRRAIRFPVGYSREGPDDVFCKDAESNNSSLFFFQSTLQSDRETPRSPVLAFPYRRGHTMPYRISRVRIALRPFLFPKVAAALAASAFSPSRRGTSVDSSRSAS